jgi:hypothetical protein
MPNQNVAIFAAIGLAAASWARMEQHIDAIIIQINKESHSTIEIDLYDENHPKPFTDKIDLLKSYFNKHPALAEDAEYIRDFATGLLRLAVERNEMIHGVLEAYDAVNGTYTLNGIRYRKKTKDFLNRRQVSPVGRIKSFAKMVNIAHYGLCEISKKLFTFDAIERLRKT